MKALESLARQAGLSVSTRLRHPLPDMGIWFSSLFSKEGEEGEITVCAMTPHHPTDLSFRKASLYGSCFLGRCAVEGSVCIRSHIRGDELGEGESIRIENSLLLQSLVHNRFRARKGPISFLIKDVVALPFANIHGSPVKGCFLGPFATIDLTPARGCSIGSFAYVQTERLNNSVIDDGQILISKTGSFEFAYRFPEDVLKSLIRWKTGQGMEGVFAEEARRRKSGLKPVWQRSARKATICVPESASVSPFAVVKGVVEIGKNVFVCHGACLENVTLGDGANAQENCILSHCLLDGDNVTAHGARILHARLEKGVFTGFNAFIRGRRNEPLIIGEKTIVMPHTVIDAKVALAIPAGHLVWGYITDEADLEAHSLPLEVFFKTQGEICMGAMRFKGSGKAFIGEFQKRIHHILEENGAFFTGAKQRGHAQTHRNTVFQFLNPLNSGPGEGLFSDIRIRG